MMTTLKLSKAILLKGLPVYQETTVINGSEKNFTTGRLYAHDVTEIALIEDGKGVHQIGNQEIPCKKGDIYIVHANTLHGYFADEQQDLKIRRLWFNVGDYFDGEVADFGDKRFCYGAFADGPLTSCARLNAIEQDKITKLLDLIAQEITDNKLEWKESVKAYLSLLLISVARCVGKAIKNTNDVPAKEYAVVATMIKSVNENYGESDFTLENLASSLFVSKSHLSKLFKKSTGQNFSHYLRSVRYLNASRLLSETNLTVEEITEKCGLRDLASFYHGFNQYYGVTPNQYRVNVKNNIKEKGDILMSIYSQISENVEKGRAKIVKELVSQAIEEGASVNEILNEGLLHGMSVIGEKFKNNEVYVPEVLVSARAMNAGIQILKPYMSENGIEATGKVCIGTVQGDLHDIGKNLVKMMMESKGLEVIDLGTDVAPETFVKTAIEENCQVICCSALLTTTMGVMEEVVKKATELGVRDKIAIMIGGAPVNEDFCNKIGADAYTIDAASAAEKAVELCKG